MNSTSTPDLGTLFGGAQTDATLSAAGAQALALNDLGTHIQQGLGVNVDDVLASDVILVAFDIDDSGSMRPNEDTARTGMNSVLDALAASKQADQILVYCRLFNSGLLYPYTPLLDGVTKKLNPALRLTAQNYRATGGTPLYDDYAITVGTAVAKVEEFKNAGVPARSITFLLTDGADAGSRTHKRPESVEPLTKDILRTEMHLVLAMGIDDGGYTDFKDIFRRMGILDKWILTPKNNASEIRRAFEMVSQSAVRASQTAAQTGNFSQVAGGFGSP